MCVVCVCVEILVNANVYCTRVHGSCCFTTAVFPFQVLVSGDLVSALKFGFPPSHRDQEVYRKLSSSLLVDCRLTAVPREWLGPPAEPSVGEELE